MKDNCQFSLNIVLFNKDKFVVLYAQTSPEMSRVSVSSGLEAEEMKRAVCYRSHQRGEREK